MKVGEILKRASVIVIGAFLFALAGFAQQKAPTPAAPAPAAPAKRKPPAAKAAPKAAAPKAPAAAPAPATPAAEASGKNRDPFRTLLVEKKAAGSDIPLRLPPGKKGLVIEQLHLEGIARALDGGWIAVVDNKTKRAYFLREKDELYNGVVSKVLADRIVFEEATIDATGRKTSREVVRKLSGDTE